MDSRLPYVAPWDQASARAAQLGFLAEWTVGARIWAEDEHDICLTHICGEDPLHEINESYSLAELVAYAEMHRCAEAEAASRDRGPM